MEPVKKTKAQRAAFYQLVTESLYNILRLDGGEWASPDAVDEVLDTINTFEKKRKALYLPPTA